MPIREALRQLQAEGLVRIIAHHQTVVAGLTLAQILELIEMRAVLEAHLVRKCAPNLDKAAVQRLRDLCDEMDQIRDYGSRWVLKNWEFHRMLYARGQLADDDRDGRAHPPQDRALRPAGRHR